MCLITAVNGKEKLGAVSKGPSFFFDKDPEAVFFACSLDRYIVQ